MGGYTCISPAWCWYFGFISNRHLGSFPAPLHLGSCGGALEVSDKRCTVISHPAPVQHKWQLDVYCQLQPATASYCQTGSWWQLDSTKAPLLSLIQFITFVDRFSSHTPGWTVFALDCVSALKLFKMKSNYWFKELRYLGAVQMRWLGHLTRRFLCLGCFENTTGAPEWQWLMIISE